MEDPKDRYHLIPNPETALVVNEIYELYAKGYGYGKIAVHLQDKKIPTPSRYNFLTGFKLKCSIFEGSLYWTDDKVRNILIDERYG